MIRRRSASWLLLLALLAGCAAAVFAAHSKPRSIEPLDAHFQTTSPGTIEASVNPPIEGVLRIVVRAGTTGGRRNSPTGSGPAQSAAQSFSIEVSQSDRPIPYRFVSESGNRKLAGGGPALLVADIDVNDLTPGIPVRVRIRSNLADPPDLSGRAYQVVY